MPRAPFLLAVLALFADAYPVRAAAPTTWNCTEHGTGGLRVCTHLDASALSGPGRSTTWWIRLEGGDIRSQARLHNSSPDVVRLERGNDQIVHMGCRRHRQVRRKVTVIGTGEPKLEARPYFASPKREAAVIAASLAQRLAEIEARFIERRAKLPPDYPTEAVSELLDTTEAELMDALSYQELVAMRDYVREAFRAARAMLQDARQETRAANQKRVSTSRVAFAFLDPSEFIMASPANARTRLAAPWSERANSVEYISTVIHKVVEVPVKKNHLVNLCVLSSPVKRAEFLFHPMSYSRGVRSTVTDGEIPNVWRGLYAYEMRRRGYSAISCKPRPKDVPFRCASLNLLDLMEDQSPVFDCDLKDGLCKPSIRSTRGCPP